MQVVVAGVDYLQFVQRKKNTKKIVFFHENVLIKSVHIKKLKVIGKGKCADELLSVYCKI